MTVTPKALQPGIMLGTGDTVLYTAPAGTKASVSMGVVVNTDVAPRTFYIRRVAAAASPDVFLIDGQTLAAGKGYVAPEVVNLVLEAGDKLVGTASVAAVVSVVLSGFEIVG